MAELPTLKRSINLPLLTFYGLGTIVGAGIYVLIGEVVGIAGHQAPLAFLIAAVVAAFTAFTYAELSSRYPKSAGEALYIGTAFHWPLLSSLVGWSIVAIGIISSATIVNGFVGYLGVFIALPDWLVISFLVLALGAIAAWGITESVWIAATITVIELSGLIYVIIVASPSTAVLVEKLPLLVADFNPSAAGGIFLAAFLAFYAFVGFEDMVNVAEEVKDPQRTMPKAILLALVISSLLYMLVAIVAVFATDPALLSQSEAPLALLIEGKPGGAPQLISAISLVAVINGALIQTIMASRVLYGMANQGLVYRQFSAVSPSRQTPIFSTAVITLLILVFALWLPLVTLASITSFITLIVFAAMHVALLVIKRREPLVEDAVSYPAWIPAIGAVLSVGLLGMQLVTSIG